MIWQDYIVAALCGIFMVTAIAAAKALQSLAASSKEIAAGARAVRLELELARDDLRGVQAAVYDHTKQAFHSVR